MDEIDEKEVCLLVRLMDPGCYEFTVEEVVLRTTEVLNKEDKRRKR